jgi:DNA/RNA endonuclease YhcR with UshA esterase domain
VKDSTLLKTSLICSILGIIILYFLSANIEIEEMNISKINTIKLGADVKLTGEIKQIKQLEKLTIIDVKKDCVVPVLLFDNITLNVGDKIKVTGKLDEYKGKKEIIAETIIKT